MGINISIGLNVGLGVLTCSVRQVSLHKRACARFLQGHEHVLQAPHKPDFNTLTLIFIATQHRKKTPTQPNSAVG